MAVAHRERLGQPVIERQIALVVITHSVVVAKIRRSGDLLGLGVDGHKAVVERQKERLRRIEKVRLHMTTLPVMLQIRTGTVVVIVECKYQSEVFVEVEVEAEKISIKIETTQSVDAGVITAPAGPRMV